MGCRVMKIQPAFVAGLLKGGWTRGYDSVEPTNVPKDLEVLSARMNFSAEPVLELLVRSSEFEGSDAATLDTAAPWSATFRRTASPPAREGKDAKPRGL
jgi:hypothetical protein